MKKKIVVVIMSFQFRIYSKKDCSYCTKAKKWFTENKFKFKEICLDDDTERKKFYEKTGVSSVPQIFIEESYIGGYSDLMKYERGFTTGVLCLSETYKPFRYLWAFDLSRKHESVHWIEDELDLNNDVNDWKSGNMSSMEKEYVTHILRLFTQSDVAVGQNYYEQFLPRFRNNEVRNMLGSFAAREAIHQRAYSMLNDTLGLPDSEYHAFVEYEELSEKFDFMTNADPHTLSGLSLCLAKSAFNEGVSLFASFVMLLNFQRFGKMKGMGKAVEWSIRDENMHVQGIAGLYKDYMSEHGYLNTSEHKEQVYDIARKVVELEDKFIELAYTLGNCEGLKKEDVKKYVRYITNQRLNQLGLPSIYEEKKNPLSWVEWIISGADHTNFFENRVTEYVVAGLKGEWSECYETQLKSN